MRNTWVVGSLNSDLVVNCPRFPLPGETVMGTSCEELPGGKGGNQAMALARLGCRPRMVGAVGADARGATYRVRLKAAGADIRGLASLEGQATGLALIEVAGGENRIVVVPGANAAVAPDMVEAGLSDLASGDIVLLQLEIPLDSVIRSLEVCRRRGALAILDPAPARPLPPAILALPAYLTPNQTEARFLAGLPAADADDPAATPPLEAARRLLAMGAAHVVQKAGASGAWLLDGSGARHAPACAVTVADTIGAGDCFNAGFACGLAHGLAPAEALAWGNAAGALSVRGRGAQSALPTLEELRQAVQRGRA
jgi:ribokinase